MKRFHLIVILIGLLILFFLIWKIGLKEILHNFKILGWGLIPIVLLEGIADIFHTFGWKACLTNQLK